MQTKSVLFIVFALLLTLLDLGHEFPGQFLLLLLFLTDGVPAIRHCLDVGLDMAQDSFVFVLLRQGWICGLPTLLLQPRLVRVICLYLLCIYYTVYPGVEFMGE